MFSALFYKHCPAKMSTTATSTTTTTSKVPNVLNLRGAEPEWLKQLHSQGELFSVGCRCSTDNETGWCVVPGVISEEKAKSYADQAYQWVESFGLGYDRNDPSTRTLDKLHYFHKGGLTNRYGIGHEQWIWDIRWARDFPLCVPLGLIADEDRTPL